jgi:hypothetical protein
MVAYPKSFDKIINLAIRLNNSFRRLEHAQKKSDKKIRNPSHKKERDSDAIDWQANNAFKKEKKNPFKREKRKKS